MESQSNKGTKFYIYATQTSIFIILKITVVYLLMDMNGYKFVNNLMQIILSNNLEDHEVFD